PTRTSRLSGVWAQRALHHLSMVERAKDPPHPERARVLTDPAPARRYRRLQHADGTDREPVVVARPAHKDDACVHAAWFDLGARSRVPPDQRPAFREGRRG